VEYFEGSSRLELSGLSLHLLKLDYFLLLLYTVLEKLGGEAGPFVLAEWRRLHHTFLLLVFVITSLHCFGSHLTILL